MQFRKISHRRMKTRSLVIRFSFLNITREIEISTFHFPNFLSCTSHYTYVHWCLKQKSCQSHDTDNQITNFEDLH